MSERMEEMLSSWRFSPTACWLREKKTRVLLALNILRGRPTHYEPLKIPDFLRGDD
jgi:hypothetical protein